MKGVYLTNLNKISHPKGDIFHALKKNDIGFKNFGEAYFSNVNSGKVKGWKKHTSMTLNLIVPIGNIKFVLLDDRESEILESDEKSFIIGESNYKRLTIPPNIFVAFQGLSKHMNLLLNIADIQHDPDEAINLPLNKYKYNWNLEDE